jgi:hypothetical protein
MNTSLHSWRLADLRDLYNDLRVRAGLKPRKNLYGTSKQALVILINRAERGEF